MFKKIFFKVGILLPSVMMCVSCTKEKQDILDYAAPEISSITKPVAYDEEPDSLDGVNAKDTSHLKNAFNNIKDNYTLRSFSYYSSNALKLYENDYKFKLSQDTTTFHTNRYQYTFSYEDETKELSNYNQVIFKQGKKYKSAIIEETPEELFALDKFNYSLSSCEGMIPSSLSNLNEDCYLKHKFKRISKNKYQTEDIEVVDLIAKAICPYMNNDGYFMTYDRAIFELDSNDNISRLRIYASITQSAKLIESHLDEEKTNWYLLFAESIIYNINKTGIDCLSYM